MIKAIWFIELAMITALAKHNADPYDSLGAFMTIALILIHAVFGSAVI